MNVYILDNFVPDDHTLKYQSSIEKNHYFPSWDGNDELVV